MMNLQSPLLLLTVMTMTNTVHAFTVPTQYNTEARHPYHRRPMPVAQTSTTSTTTTTSITAPLWAASIDESEKSPSAATAESKEDASSGNNNGNELSFSDAELQEVRQEIIQKYVTAGRDLSYAEAEVDKFLSDPERSEQFLEMRRYAKAQANDLGFEFVFQLGGAFAIGLFANVVVKYYAAYKNVYPVHDGPIPFL